MDTLTKSCSPTIVITANGEVQTHEEATVYVKELERFMTMKVLDNTPAVLSLGKLCDENGYSYEWINGQKPHLVEDGIRIICNTENFVLIVVPGLSSSSSASSSTSRTPMKQEIHSSSSSSSSRVIFPKEKGCTQRQCEVSQNIVDNYRTMFESRISAGGLEKLPFSQNIRISSWSYDIEGHAKKCVWNDIVSWQTRLHNNSIRYLPHALMTITSKRRKQNLLENCQLLALKLFLNAYIWQELDDLIFYGQ